MKNCCNCCKEKNILIIVPMYGLLCGDCYQEIISDYLN